MRHAKSAWDTDAPSDFERPLAKRGQHDAPRMGDWIKSQKLIPDFVVCSPAERASQTALIVCQAFDFKKKKIKFDSRIYGAGTEDLLEVLAEVPRKCRVTLLVGHNPGLEFLFSHLTGPSAALPSTEESYGDSYDNGVIKTATIAQLRMPDDWSALKPGCAALVTVKTPRDVES
ncbi:MAG: histidine phosphatase family protein [Magnetococcales bacterium]|nr:histidine phosphatase family protein [Magnetococcales bacterium]